MSVIGSLIRTVQAGKEQKRKAKQIREAGTIADRMDRIKEFRPELEIDRSGINDYTKALEESKKFANKQLDRATYNKITSGGRAAGDELARDENRRASSNAVSNVTRSAGSASDVMSMIGMAQAQEQAGNRSIDASSQAQMVQNQRAAEAGVVSAASGVSQAKRDYSSGLFNANQFNTDADLSEFQENELNPYMQAFSDERQLASAYEQARFQRQEGWAQAADDYMAAQNQIKQMAISAVTGTVIPDSAKGPEGDKPKQETNPYNPALNTNSESGYGIGYDVKK